jgi:ribonucleoside-triphosphate reductase (thioredoxin)
MKKKCFYQIFKLERNYSKKFKLSKNFISGFQNKNPPFGFNGLGELVYKRTYSRLKEDEQVQEEWFETVERVCNGTFNLKKEWILQNHLSWDDQIEQEVCQKMYKKIFEMKFLPPGRGLWYFYKKINIKKGNGFKTYRRKVYFLLKFKENFTHL